VENMETANKSTIRKREDQVPAIPTIFSKNSPTSSPYHNKRVRLSDPKHKFTTVWTQYEVALDLSDTSLRIDIQDIYSGATFTKDILGDHAKPVTKICNTLQELFETLKML